MITTQHPQASAMESILVERNQNLIWHITKKYGWANLEPADLFTEGVQGLLIAARRFDPNKGCKFSTMAVHWIRQCIGRASEQSGTIRVPSHCYESISKLLQAYEVLGQDASQEELCSYLRWTPAKLEGILLARKVGRIASLDAPITTSSTKGDKDTELIEFFAATGNDPFELVAGGAQSAALESLIDQLPERQAAIIRERYLNNDNPTLLDVGRIVGLTRERVRQIEVMALKNLKLAALKAGLHAT